MSAPPVSAAALSIDVKSGMAYLGGQNPLLAVSDRDLLRDRAVKQAWEAALSKRALRDVRRVFPNQPRVRSGTIHYLAPECEHRARYFSRVVACRFVLMDR